MRRGFTLIEISIVIAILTVMTVPFLSTYVSMYAQFRALTMQVDAKADADAAVARIFQQAGRGRYVLDSDNHGVRFADGASVRWERGRLMLRARGAVKPMLVEKVTEFNIVRRHDSKVLTVNLAVAAPARVGGRDITWRYLYDYPRGSEAR